MAREKKGKPKKKEEVAKGREKPEPARPLPAEQDDAVDYGGLPDRNMKKNLGCG